MCWPASGLQDVLAEARDQAGIIKAIGQMLALYPSARVLWPSCTAEPMVNEESSGMEMADPMPNAADRAELCEDP